MHINYISIEDTAVPLVYRKPRLSTVTIIIIIIIMKNGDLLNAGPVTYLFVQQKKRVIAYSYVRHHYGKHQPS
jgi:hypothetical protein